MGGYAQQALDTILNAMRARDARNNQAQQVDIQNRALKSQDDARKEEEQFRRDQLAQQQKQFNVTTKAASALHELQIAQAEQEIGQTAASTGIVPGGVEQFPAVQPTADQPLVLKGLEQNKLIFPSGHSISVPTPKDYATQQADLTRIKNAPGEESRIRETNATQDAELKRNMAVNLANAKARMEEEKVKQGYEDARLTRTLAATHANELLRTNTQMQIARMNASGGLGLGGGSTPVIGPDGTVQMQSVSPNKIYSDAMDDAVGLRLSSNEFKARYGAKQAPILEKLLRANNIGFLDKQHMDQFNDLNQVAMVLPNLKNLIDMQSQHPYEVVNPLSSVGQDYNAQLEIVKRSIPKIITSLANVKRFQKDEAQNILNSLIPNKMSGVVKGDASNAQQKFNSFVVDMQNEARTILNQLPKQHQDMAIDRLGFNNYPYMQKTMEAPGQEVQSPAGATQPGKPMIVRRKADGTLGILPDSSKFDENIYEIPGKEKK